MLGSRNSQHSFAQIPDVKIQRSQFDRSFTIKDTFDFDYLVPIFVDEMLPGDTARVDVNTFARLATQKVPIMDNMFVDYFFFFVPNRLVWDNWEKMNGQQTDPGDSTDYILPAMTMTAGGPEVGSIFDKMGLPTDIATGYTVPNTLPLRAYIKIWNDWFRDQNLQDSVTLPTDDGPDVPGDFALLKRGKRHDYFTSALPWPQKGDAVSLPLGTTAPVIGNGSSVQVHGTGATTDRLMYIQTGNPGNVVLDGWLGGTEAARWSTDSTKSGLIADLSDAAAATINQLREAFSMQALFELDARGGTRYVEVVRAHFNVTIPDFRLQRAEFLGGGTSKINAHPVAQTAITSGSNALGQLASFATSSTSGGAVGFSKSFVEHGYVIGLACARADLTYQQGINKMWLRSTRYDFYWPKLAELGEQAILNKEIYVQGTSADTDVFGYQERYAEYRYKPSEIHGEFRSTYATSLDQWHLAEEFGSLPALNAAFIVQNTPIDRAIAVSSEPHLLFDAYFSYKHARPMPVYSVPATLGRF